jgi:hypothetical protein
LVANRATPAVSASSRPAITGPIPNRHISVVPVVATPAAIWAPAAFILAPGAVMPARWS